MAVKQILLLGNDTLYQVSDEISKNQLDKPKQVVNDLHDTMMNFRKSYGFGRAIAAPQINELVRIIYMNIDGQTTVFMNPRLEFPEDEKMEIWDDCMSFPGLEVKIMRYKKVRVHYLDLQWQDCVIDFEGDLAELIQHEYDHLDGILSLQRAIDDKSFRMNREKAVCY